MATDIPYGEPDQIRSGDTTAWLKTIADYPPADGWTLKYSLRSSTQKINIIATISGADYLVSITAAASAAYVADRYQWIAYVTKGAEQYTKEEGYLDVLPNLSADTVYDTRTDARKIYDDLLAAYKTYCAGGQGHIDEYQISGRMIRFRNVKEIVDQLTYWCAAVRQEEGRSGRILVRLNG